MDLTYEAFMRLLSMGEDIEFPDGLPLHRKGFDEQEEDLDDGFDALGGKAAHEVPGGSG